MISAKPISFVVKFFHLLFSWQLRKNFKNIIFHGVESIPLDKSILMIGNHYSYWDGICLFRLNGMHFKKNYFVMILEETLKSNMILRYSGAFSIKKNSRDAIKSLIYASNLLKDKQNLVLIFPQGKIESQLKYPLTFHKGIESVLHNHDSNIVLAAAFTENFTEKKASAYVYLKHLSGDFDPKDIERLYNEHYLESRNRHVEKYSE
jgi:1-acyl-sn-glycerol-3-phosphate acyltransferase